MADTTHKIEKLAEIVDFLLKQNSRHAFVIESLLVKAEYTKSELVDLIQKADVDHAARTRSDWQLKQKSSNA